MNIKADALSGGFSEPVFQSQAIFKMLMDGMARPGTIQSVSPTAQPPAPLDMAAGSILLTLCDHDTAVWFSPALCKTVAADWLRFHTGAPLTDEKTEARFAIVEVGSTLAPFALFCAGTQEYPDRSTTVIIAVSDFETGPALTLSGPGIRHRQTISPAGLPDIFARLWRDNRASFPRGVDVILTAGGRFLCLPRSVTIETTEN
jgi:alpha-D-ribose 1-methylphosphonate 5-triphosphate synthase subunit PhnH